MDLNNIFLVAVAVTNLALLICPFILRLPFTYAWKPLLILVFLLIVDGVSFKLAPASAGYISLSLWIWLFLLPTVAIRLFARYFSRQQYHPAYALARFMARCYFFFGSWRHEMQIIQLLGLAQQGHLAQVSQLLTEYQRTRPGTALARFARSYFYRLHHQWEEMVQWVETARFQDKILDIDPTIVLLYLRALGEIGELDRLLSAFLQRRSLLARLRQLNQAYLFIFAFCGERAAVEQLLQGPLRSFSPALKQFWRATANLSAGEIDEGMQLLTALLQNEDWTIHNAAKRRLSHPLIMARYQLSVPSQKQLAGFIREIEYKKRFKLAASLRHSKPYLTYALILLNLLCFLLEVRAGGSEDGLTLYRLGGLVVPDVITTGEWWRVLAAQFLHFGPLHLIVNMLAFIWLGPFVETRLGKWRYVLVYFASGTGSLLVAVILAQLQLFPRAAIVGASGGLMGLAGAMGAVALRDWWHQGARTARNIFIAILVGIALQAVSDLIIFPQASFIGHLSGALLGFLLASQLKHLVPAPKALAPPKSESFLH